MSKTKPLLTLFTLILLLCSCGRTDNGSIINNTRDTLSITLKLNYPANDNKPDNYLREQIIKGEKSQVKESKLGGDCVTDFDTLNNVATILLFPNDELHLGTIRAGFSRNDYQTWEFTEINARGRNMQIDARDEGIMSFVKFENRWFSHDNYYFMIGQK
jgi:hypothetical protein